MIKKIIILLIPVLFMHATGQLPFYNPAGKLTANGNPIVVQDMAATYEDFTGDGIKDLIAGDATGGITVFTNTGTDSAPVFSTPSYLEADGEKIQLTSS